MISSLRKQCAFPGRYGHEVAIWPWTPARGTAPSSKSNSSRGEGATSAALDVTDGEPEATKSGPARSSGGAPYDPASDLMFALSALSEATDLLSSWLSFPN